MHKSILLAATAMSAIASPVLAQDTQDEDAVDDNVIIVTAQRQAQSLQEVPIAVSAFDSKALEAQQIENTSDLQLTLPNVTFTKTNFTSASFTIRGIGDLCVGTSCDSATGIHINDMPLLASRLFETEYFDLERIEVLRGPQGTLFGRNATSGVVNVITRKPDLGEFNAQGDLEYGNFNSIKVKGAVNLPIGDTLAVRVAGYYLKRDGYTTNVTTGNDIDGRDIYSVRGSLRWEPGADTSIDLMVSYFKEDDNRSRIQKQLCHNDPTGVLGCLPDKLLNERTNRNAALGSIVSSPEFLGIATGGALTAFGINSIFSPQGDISQPDGLRNVALDFEPTYKADELIIYAKVEHDFGAVKLSVKGGYTEGTLESRTDYFLSVGPAFDASTFATVLGATPVAQALLDGNGNVCVSETSTGTFSGFGGGGVAFCSPNESEYDVSSNDTRQWSIEGLLSSDFDGPLNFLVGGLYLNSRASNDYFVVSSGIDYASAILGYAQSLNPALGVAPGSLFLGAPYFDNSTDKFTLKSYGVFGEAYWDVSDALQITAGLRYSNDKKFVRDRNVILNFPVPVGETDIFNSPFAGVYDADASTPGNQLFREQTVKFNEITGRLVVNYEVGPENLLYASFSRGYKSGGINPPFNAALFTAPATFEPEIVQAFEIGSKNQFGALQLNATAFFYKYKDLQLSRIINRTSFNDNTDADIYGVELEAVVQPDPAWIFNANASYLKTKIKSFSLVDTRDPSGGRGDVIIIKDVTSAANCVVIPNAALPASALVNAVNGAVGLPGAGPIPGLAAQGAFGICSALAATAAGAFGGAFTVADGVPVQLGGNELPQAPQWKFSAGAQYTAQFSNDMNLVLRADLAYTGGYFSRSFNRNIDRIEGYEIVNLSATLNGADDRWYVKGFVQNLTGNNAITGQYITDPATALFTNVFTLDPRRYGIAAGFKF